MTVGTYFNALSNANVNGEGLCRISRFRPAPAKPVAVLHWSGQVTIMVQVSFRGITEFALALRPNISLLSNLPQLYLLPNLFVVNHLSRFNEEHSCLAFLVPWKSFLLQVVGLFVDFFLL